MRCSCLQGWRRTGEAVVGVAVDVDVATGVADIAGSVQDHSSADKNQHDRLSVCGSFGGRPRLIADVFLGAALVHVASDPL